LLRARLRWRQEDQGIHLAVDKYGFPLAITVSPANRHDSKGIVPVLHQLAGRGFKGTALGDLSYRGERLSKAGEALGITIQPSAGGHGGTFIPEGIRWVVEIVFTQMTKADVLALRTGGQNVTDLDTGVGDDHTVRGPANSPPLTAGTEPLGEAEPSLTNNPICKHTLRQLEYT
jgi:hypothetical protein